MDHITDPLLLLFLLSSGFLICLWRRSIGSRRRLGLVTIVFAGLSALCTPAVVFLLLGSLEWWYSPIYEASSEAKPIVILSGSLRTVGGDWEHVALGQDSLSRCLRGAEVYRQLNHPLVVVSGGKVTPERPGPTLARAMATFLEGQGVDAGDLVLEEKSRTTHENAVESAQLLRQRGIEKVVLVTDATHLWRAESCFRSEGIEVDPCSAYYRAKAFHWSLWSFLPDAKAARDSKRASHEWLGLAWYWLRGWI